MTDSDLLHQTLYHALLDIRSQGKQHGDKAIFHLADLFHNIALQMGKAAAGEKSYSEVLMDLKEQAKLGGTNDWLDNVLTQIDRPSANS